MNQDAQHTEQEASVIARWFGFAGGRAMATKARIFTQILYRVYLLLGHAYLIIAHGKNTGNDPRS